ncbi:LamG domain-containing protein [Actinoplanes sp. TBRC 11911]|uniref:LamG domain-containing protein n=1 Tax=Actinoplanes sp. TBRC 11911 TaxID=2729386 RepID=UPI00145EB32E|nr:LamG domain-containing protein [Actinoplanes sp. TBRC 11911]NMO51680.1 LamG domain-containing protein [Actinoplanes sp. TBRC 11911]
MPDADTTQSIRATWEWQHLVGSAWQAMTAPAVSSTPANTLATSAVASGAANGQTYQFRVKGTDPSPYNQSSNPSAWCTFTIDTQDPTVTGTVAVQPDGPGKAGQFTISSPNTDVTKFRYGWNAAVTEVTPTTSTASGKSVIVTLTPPKYGLNTLYLQGVDATGNVGDGSLTFTVDRASPAVARWGLETYPGVAASAATADLQPGLAGDTPLSVNAVTWTDKGRLVDGTQATFTGSGDLMTSGPVLDTSKSFGFAVWVKLDRLDVFQNLLSQDGLNGTNFQLEYRPDDRSGDGVADKSLCFTMRASDIAVSAPGMFDCSINNVTAGQWMHVAAAFDAPQREMRIWTDGVLRQQIAATTFPGWASAGPVRVGDRMLGPGNIAAPFYGALADLQLFDRAIVQEDLTGDDTDPDQAVEGERGILNAIQVAQWDFEDATPCWSTTIANTCAEPDNHTGFGKRLGFTQGVEVLNGAAGNYANFDDQQLFWDDPSDPYYGTTTREYGVSQRNTGDSANPVWQDAPVLKTDQSFTVTARVHIDALDKTMTAVAAKGVTQSAFYLGTRPEVVGGVSTYRFEVMVPTGDVTTSQTYVHVFAPEALSIDDEGMWHDLAVTYDAGTRRISLFVNGALKASQVLSNPIFGTTGPISVGGGWVTPVTRAGSYTEPWFGGIDDVNLYQGAMTEAQVAALNPAPEL